MFVHLSLHMRRNGIISNYDLKTVVLITYKGTEMVTIWQRFIGFIAIFTAHAQQPKAVLE